MLYVTCKTWEKNVTDKILLLGVTKNVTVIPLVYRDLISVKFQPLVDRSEQEPVNTIQP